MVYKKQLSITPDKSQSPQTGQFNSYASIATIGSMWIVGSLNPLKRVNSILTFTESENT